LSIELALEGGGNTTLDNIFMCLNADMLKSNSDNDDDNDSDIDNDNFYDEVDYKASAGMLNLLNSIIEECNH
jgi:hypothetical protein